MRLVPAVLFSIFFFACSHAVPPPIASPSPELPALACGRTPTELWVPVETQRARLSICAQLSHERSVDGERYTLVFEAVENGVIGNVTLHGADGRRIDGNIADCFAGVMAQAELGAALGGTCVAAIPIRVVRDTAPALMLAASGR